MIFGLFGGDKKRVAELIAASRTGDTDKIKQLLTKGADVNAPEPVSGDTPLLAAIDKFQWAAARILLKNNPDLNLQDKNGNSPLYLSVSQGDSALPIVNLLLEAGANPELGPSRGDNAGATPLHIACATGANGCLESLLRHGASSTKLLPSGASPMHTATIGGDHMTIELLCNAGGNVNALNDENYTPLHNTGITGNVNVTTALIRLGADVNLADNEGCTPLMKAVIKDQTEVAKVLLDNGADPDVVVLTDSTPLYPLFVAAMHGCDDMIRTLLDHGANVTAKVDGAPSLVDVAKHEGHESTGKLIAAAIKSKKLAAKVAIGPAKEIAALWKKIAQSVGQQDFESIRKFAASKHFGALEPEARLMVWSILGDTKQLQALIDAGANPNKTYDEVLTGISPLYAAVGLTQNLEIATLLLNAGADSNLEWENGATPIFEALTDQRVKFLKLLIDKGANVNAKMGNGKTSLIQATVNNSGLCVDLLLDAGANINAVLPSNGLGPFGVAVDRLKMDMALHLLNRGAKPEFGTAETLGLAVAEHGSIELICAIEKAGGSIIRPDQLGRVVFVGSRNRDCEVLDYLFNHGADISKENECKYTPLIISVLRGHTELVRRYTERGDDVSVRDADGETALSLAIEKRKPEMISILRKHGAEVRDYPGLSETEAMLKASQDGALGTILNLWDAGASINIEDAEGNSPMIHATREGHLGVVRSLYHLGADINHKNHLGHSATNIATAMGHISILATMKEFVADDSVPEVLKGASLGGIHDLGDMMLGRTSHPGKENPPYDSAPDETDDESEPEGIRSTDNDQADDHEPTADEILEQLGRLKEMLSRPYIAAKFEAEGMIEIINDIEAIQNNGPSDAYARQIEGLLGLFEQLKELPVEESLPPFFQAVSDGNLREVKQFLKSGADANASQPDGTTVLMKAAESGQVSVVAELLKSGAEVQQRRSDDFTALLVACLLGHEDIVKLLVSNGADINARYTFASANGGVGNNTVLSVSAQRGSLAMCKLLVKLGAGINVVTDAGYTPLMGCLVNGLNEDIALYLLQLGADPDPDVVSKVSFSLTTTPLALASTNGVVRVVKDLIQRKANLNKLDGEKKTALKLAAMRGQTEIVNMLIKAGAEVNVPDHEGWTALMNAAGDGNLEMAKALLKAGADVNATSTSGDTALIQALGKRLTSITIDSLQAMRRGLNGDDNCDDDQAEGTSDALDVIKLLLKQGANPNVFADGAPLLANAKDNGDIELVKLLKKHGATVDPVMGNAQTSKASLINAVSEGKVQRVIDLLGTGADINFVNPDGFTALSVAASGLMVDSISRRMRRNLQEIADLLILQGADIDVDGCNPCPLGTAAFLGDLHLVNAMLKRGAKTESIFMGQGTPLLAAISKGHEECAMALINAGADVQATSKNGLTVLQGASTKNFIQVINAVLTMHPTLIDQVDKDGCTPLMSAARAGNKEAVQTLLRLKANPALRNSDGMTAADHATKNGHMELSTIFS